MKNLKTDNPRALLIGIGNNGRGDDGLGWNFAEMVHRTVPEYFECEFRYQLQIEDSLLISEYDIVIFADATQQDLMQGYELCPVFPATHYFYSSHIQSPETILYLSGDIYGKHPEAYTMKLSGYQWGLKTGLSTEAVLNVQAALAYFLRKFIPGIKPRLKVNAQLHHH